MAGSPDCHVPKKSASLHWPSTLFVLLILMVVGLSGFRIVRLWPLYTDAQYRLQVLRTVEQFAELQGFLLSSIDIAEATPAKISLRIREYHRGRDAFMTIDLPIGPAVINP